MSYIGEPLRSGVLEHGGENAVLPGQRADGLPLLLAHPIYYELGETPVIVWDPQSGILRIEQLTGGHNDGL